MERATAKMATMMMLNWMNGMMLNGMTFEEERNKALLNLFAYFFICVYIFFF